MKDSQARLGAPPRERESGNSRAASQPQSHSSRPWRRASRRTWTGKRPAVCDRTRNGAAAIGGGKANSMLPCMDDEEYSLPQRILSVPIRREKQLYYVDSLRHSGWRSEAKGLLNCPEQLVHSARSAVDLVTPPRLNKGAPSSVGEWAAQIQSVWVQGTTNTLELARIVSRARRAMGYGDWAR